MRVLQIGGCLRIADDAAEQYAAVLRYTGAPAALRTSGSLRADLVDWVRELVAGREREGEVVRHNGG
jgi:hypothetical protein